MSQRNIDVQRAFLDACRRGDWDAVAANADPDILIRTDQRWPEQRIYGREAWIAFLRGVWEAWGPDLRIEEAVDLGDRVLTRQCWSIHGQHSGIEGEQRYSAINTFREGRVVFVEFFIEHEQALEALEMRE
jgi:ketosteroid isomerase-like protein